MEYFNIGMGVFFVGMGFLIKKYPILIAGYNTMSEERKKKVDVEGLSTWMRNCFIFMGILIIGGPYLFNYLGLDRLGKNIILVATLGVIPFLLINAQRYDHNTSGKLKNYIINISLLILIGAFVGGTITYATYPPTVELKNKTLNISGMYGINTEIESIELTPKLPKITMRTNGFHFNETSKGNFKIEGGGTAKLFLNSGEGPFIFVRTTQNIPIFINRKTTNETQMLFKELQSKIE